MCRVGYLGVADTAKICGLSVLYVRNILFSFTPSTHVREAGLEDAAVEEM